MPQLLKPARFRAADPEAHERRATWLELFFDLVFVVAVAQLAHVLHDDLSVGGFLRYVGLFVPVWWAWMTYTYFADQFDNGDLVHQLATFAAMFCVASLSTFIQIGMDDSARGFALSYIALRLIVIALFLRARRHAPDARELTDRFIAGNALGVGFWLASLAVQGDGRYVIWAVALSIEIVTPIAAVRAHRHGPVSSATHVPERIGLFTIIVLGETIVAVADGVSSIAWEASSIVAAASGLLIGAGAWQIYFSRLDGIAIKRTVFWAFAYPFAHLPLFAGIVAAGVGAEIAISHAADDHLDLGSRVALCGGVALVLLASSIVCRGASRDVDPRGELARLLGAALLVGATILAGSVPPPALVLGVAATLAAVAAVELVVAQTPALSEAP